MILLALIGCDALFGRSDEDELRFADLDADGWSLAEGDCDDENPDAYPENDETCDDLDNDCDDEVDEGTGATWTIDADLDGYGDDSPGVIACDQPQNYIAVGGDCDDEDPSIHPGAEEICDELDQDCDLFPDEGVTSVWYADGDDDGYGNAEYPAEGCEQPFGTADNDFDCNDEEASINPTASDGCNEIDDDCDEAVDEEPDIPYYRDEDEDGYGDPELFTVSCSTPTGYVDLAEDCDDSDASINPDTLWYSDTDADGFGDPDASQASCEAPSGTVADSTDCDDTLDSTYPGADETCDEADDDCDSSVDEGVLSTFYTDADGDGYGLDSSTTEACTLPSGYADVGGDCDDTKGARYPGSSEVCNEADDDCDGSTDEGVTTTYYADTDGDGYGDASSTDEACSQPSGYVTDSTDCDDSGAAIYPGASESCNEGDDDCDSVSDEGVTTTYYADTDGDGYGDASSTDEACSTPSGYSEDSTDCDDSDSGVNPGETEICNDGIDQDCDGGPGTCGVDGTHDVSTSSGYDAVYIGDSYDYAGESVAIGDLDDDGDDDLVIGAFYHYINGYDGWAHGVYGPTTSGGTLSSVADVTWAGESGSQYGVGYAAEMDDVDGDGVDDLVLGGHSGVFLVYGPASISFELNSTYADVILEDGTSGSFYGDAVETGDVDGDGLADLLVGAPYQTGAYYQEGAALLYLGSSVGTLEATYEGTNYADRFAFDIDIVPDTNGDGYDELLMGAPENDTYGTGYGAAYMQLGGTAFSDITMSNSTAPTDAWFRTSATYATSRLGYGVGGVGDIDGDGYGDVGMSAYWANGTGGSSSAYGGRVAIFFGPVSGNHYWHNGDVIVTGEYTERLASFIGGDDLDGDGQNDLLLGTEDSHVHYSNAGGALVFYGPMTSGTTMASTDANVIMTPTAAYDRLGSDMAVGDMNDDGTPDLIVGASYDAVSSYRDGAVYLLFGGSY